MIAGSMCKMHSLTLNPSSDLDAEWERILRAPPGEIVMLQQAPLSVNVELSTDTPWPTDETLEVGKIVVPIIVAPRPKARELHLVRRGKAQKKTTLHFFDFGVELAFAITYHKIQGQTLSRIILDLNGSGHGALSVAQFYVGISRVRFGEHIRIFPIRMEAKRKLEQAQFRNDIITWRAGPHYNA
jgi:hypothetical protein